LLKGARPQMPGGRVSPRQCESWRQVMGIFDALITAVSGLQAQ
jgi:hypothetical protein